MQQQGAEGGGKRAKKALEAVQVCCLLDTFDCGDVARRELLRLRYLGEPAVSLEREADLKVLSVTLPDGYVAVTSHRAERAALAVLSEATRICFIYRRYHVAVAVDLSDSMYSLCKMQTMGGAEPAYAVPCGEVFPMLSALVRALQLPLAVPASGVLVHTAVRLTVVAKCRRRVRRLVDGALVRRDDVDSLLAGVKHGLDELDRSREGPAEASDAPGYPARRKRGRSLCSSALATAFGADFELEPVALASLSALSSGTAAELAAGASASAALAALTGTADAASKAAEPPENGKLFVMQRAGRSGSGPGGGRNGTGAGTSPFNASGGGGIGISNNNNNSNTSSSNSRSAGAGGGSGNSAGAGAGAATARGPALSGEEEGQDLVSLLGEALAALQLVDGAACPCAVMITDGVLPPPLAPTGDESARSSLLSLRRLDVPLFFCHLAAHEMISGSFANLPDLSNLLFAATVTGGTCFDVAFLRQVALEAAAQGGYRWTRVRRVSKKHRDAAEKNQRTIKGRTSATTHGEVPVDPLSVWATGLVEEYLPHPQYLCSIRLLASLLCRFSRLEDEGTAGASTASLFTLGTSDLSTLSGPAALVEGGAAGGAGAGGGVTKASTPPVKEAAQRLPLQPPAALQLQQAGSGTALRQGPLQLALALSQRAAAAAAAASVSSLATTTLGGRVRHSFAGVLGTMETDDLTALGGGDAAAGPATGPAAGPAAEPAATAGAAIVPAAGMRRGPRLETDTKSLRSSSGQAAGSAVPVILGGGATPFYSPKVFRASLEPRVRRPQGIASQRQLTAIEYAYPWHGRPPPAPVVVQELAEYRCALLLVDAVVARLKDGFRIKQVLFDAQAVCLRLALAFAPHVTLNYVIKAARAVPAAGAASAPGLRRPASAVTAQLGGSSCGALAASASSINGTLAAAAAASVPAVVSVRLIASADLQRAFMAAGKQLSSSLAANPTAVRLHQLVNTMLEGDRVLTHLAGLFTPLAPPPADRVASALLGAFAFEPLSRWQRWFNVESYDLMFQSAAAKDELVQQALGDWCSHVTPVGQDGVLHLLKSVAALTQEPRSPPGAGLGQVLDGEHKLLRLGVAGVLLGRLCLLSNQVAALHLAVPFSAHPRSVRALINSLLRHLDRCARGRMTRFKHSKKPISELVKVTMGPVSMSAAARAALSASATMTAAAAAMAATAGAATGAAAATPLAAATGAASGMAKATVTATAAAAAPDADADPAARSSRSAVDAPSKELARGPLLRGTLLRLLSFVVEEASWSWVVPDGAAARAVLHALVRARLSETFALTSTSLTIEPSGPGGRLAIDEAESSAASGFASFCKRIPTVDGGDVCLAQYRVSFSTTSSGGPAQPSGPSSSSSSGSSASSHARHSLVVRTELWMDSSEQQFKLHGNDELGSKQMRSLLRQHLERVDGDIVSSCAALLELQAWATGDAYAPWGGAQPSAAAKEKGAGNKENGPRQAQRMQEQGRADVTKGWASASSDAAAQAQAQQHGGDGEEGELEALWADEEGDLGAALAAKAANEPARDGPAAPRVAVRNGVQSLLQFASRRSHTLPMFQSRGGRSLPLNAVLYHRFRGSVDRVSDVRVVDAPGGPVKAAEPPPPASSPSPASLSPPPAPSDVYCAKVLDASTVLVFRMPLRLLRQPPSRPYVVEAEAVPCGAFLQSDPAELAAAQEKAKAKPVPLPPWEVNSVELDCFEIDSRDFVFPIDSVDKQLRRLLGYEQAAADTAQQLLLQEQLEQQQLQLQLQQQAMLPKKLPPRMWQQQSRRSAADAFHEQVRLCHSYDMVLTAHEALLRGREVSGEDAAWLLRQCPTTTALVDSTLLRSILGAAMSGRPGDGPQAKRASAPVEEINRRFESILAQYFVPVTGTAWYLFTATRAGDLIGDDEGANDDDEFEEEAKRPGGGRASRKDDEALLISTLPLSLGSSKQSAPSAPPPSQQQGQPQPQQQQGQPQQQLDQPQQQPQQQQGQPQQQQQQQQQQQEMEAWGRRLRSLVNRRTPPVVFRVAVSAQDADWTEEDRRMRSDDTRMSAETLGDARICEAVMAAQVNPTPGVSKVTINLVFGTLPKRPTRKQPSLVRPGLGSRPISAVGAKSSAEQRRDMFDEEVVWAWTKTVRRRIRACVQSMISSAVLMALQRVYPVTERTISLVQQLLDRGSLPASAIERATIPLQFVQQDLGVRLFREHVGATPVLSLRRVGSSDVYFVVEPLDEPRATPWGAQEEDEDAAQGSALSDLLRDDDHEPIADAGGSQHAISRRASAEVRPHGGSGGALRSVSNREQSASAKPRQRRREYVVPYWAIVTVMGASVNLEFHHPTLALAVPSRARIIIDFVKNGLLKTAERVNQMILLFQLHETRIASRLLIEPDPVEAPPGPTPLAGGRGAAAGSTGPGSWRNAVMQRQQTAGGPASAQAQAQAQAQAAQAWRRRGLPATGPLAPPPMPGARGSGVPGQGQLRGSASGSSLSGQGSAGGDEEGDSLGEGFPNSMPNGRLACPCYYREAFPVNERLHISVAMHELRVNALHPFVVTNRRNTFVYRDRNGQVFHLLLKEVLGEAQKGVQDKILLEVYGVDAPSQGMRDVLSALLTNKIAAATLSALGRLLLRNPQFKVQPFDLAFVQSASPTRPEARYVAEVPTFVRDPLVFLLMLRRNLERHMSQLNLGFTLPDNFSPGTAMESLRVQRLGPDEPASGGHGHAGMPAPSPRGSVSTASSMFNDEAEGSADEAGPWLASSAWSGGGGGGGSSSSKRDATTRPEPSLRMVEVRREDYCFFFNSVADVALMKGTSTSRGAAADLGSGLAFSFVSLHEAWLPRAPAPSGKTAYAGDHALGAARPRVGSRRSSSADSGGELWAERGVTSVLVQRVLALDELGGQVPSTWEDGEESDSASTSGAGVPARLPASAGAVTSAGAGAGVGAGGSRDSDEAESHQHDAPAGTAQRLPTHRRHSSASSEATLARIQDARAFRGSVTSIDSLGGGSGRPGGAGAHEGTLPGMVASGRYLVQVDLWQSGALNLERLWHIHETAFSHALVEYEFEVYHAERPLEMSSGLKGFSRGDLLPLVEFDSFARGGPTGTLPPTFDLFSVDTDPGILFAARQGLLLEASRLVSALQPDLCQVVAEEAVPRAKELALLPLFETQSASISLRQAAGGGELLARTGQLVLVAAGHINVGLPEREQLETLLQRHGDALSFLHSSSYSLQDGSGQVVRLAMTEGGFVRAGDIQAQHCTLPALAPIAGDPQQQQQQQPPAPGPSQHEAAELSSPQPPTVPSGAAAAPAPGAGVAATGSSSGGLIASSSTVSNPPLLTCTKKRGCYTLVSVSSRSINVLLYNWAPTKGKALQRALRLSVAWARLRCEVLRSILLQRMGVYSYMIRAESLLFFYELSGRIKGVARPSLGPAASSSSSVALQQQPPQQPQPPQQQQQLVLQQQQQQQPLQQQQQLLQQLQQALLNASRIELWFLNDLALLSENEAPPRNLIRDVIDQDLAGAGKPSDLGAGGSALGSKPGSVVGPGAGVGARPRDTLTAARAAMQKSRMRVGAPPSSSFSGSSSASVASGSQQGAKASQGGVRSSSSVISGGGGGGGAGGGNRTRSGSVLGGTSVVFGPASEGLSGERVDLEVFLKDHQQPLRLVHDGIGGGDPLRRLGTHLAEEASLVQRAQASRKLVAAVITRWRQEWISLGRFSGLAARSHDMLMLDQQEPSEEPGTCTCTAVELQELVRLSRVLHTVQSRTFFDEHGHFNRVPAEERGFKRQAQATLVRVYANYLVQHLGMRLVLPAADAYSLAHGSGGAGAGVPGLRAAPGRSFLASRSSSEAQPVALAAAPAEPHPHSHALMTLQKVLNGAVLLVQVQVVDGVLRCSMRLLEPEGASEPVVGQHARGKPEDAEIFQLGGGGEQRGAAPGGALPYTLELGRLRASLNLAVVAYDFHVFKFQRVLQNFHRNPVGIACQVFHFSDVCPNAPTGAHNAMVRQTFQFLIGARSVQSHVKEMFEYVVDNADRYGMMGLKPVSERGRRYLFLGSSGGSVAAPVQRGAPRASFTFSVIVAEVWQPADARPRPTDQRQGSAIALDVCLLTSDDESLRKAVDLEAAEEEQDGPQQLQQGHDPALPERRKVDPRLPAFSQQLEEEDFDLEWEFDNEDEDEDDVQEESVLVIPASEAATPAAPTHGDDMSPNRSRVGGGGGGGGSGAAAGPVRLPGVRKDSFDVFAPARRNAGGSGNQRANMEEALDNVDLYLHKVFSHAALRYQRKLFWRYVAAVASGAPASATLQPVSVEELQKLSFRCELADVDPSLVELLGVALQLDGLVSTLCAAYGPRALRCDDEEEAVLILPAPELELSLVLLVQADTASRRPDGPRSPRSYGEASDAEEEAEPAGARDKAAAAGTAAAAPRRVSPGGVSLCFPRVTLQAGATEDAEMFITSFVKVLDRAILDSIAGDAAPWF